MSLREENVTSLKNAFYTNKDPSKQRASATLVGDETGLGGDIDASEHTLIYEIPKNTKPSSRFAWMWTGEWWPCWWGLIQFIVLTGATYAGYHGVKIDQFDPPVTATVLPGPWTDNPIIGWKVNNTIAFFVMAIFTLLLVIPGFIDIVIEKGEKWSKKRGRDLTIQLFVAFTFQSFIALIAFVLGTEQSLNKVGLGNETWAIIIGIVICNGIAMLGYEIPGWMYICAKAGETYVATGLILLGIDIQTVLSLGASGVVVAVPVTCIVLAFAYWIARKIVSVQQRKMAMLICAGLSICGSSASTAVQTTIGATTEDLTVGIAIVSIFTIIQMLIAPPVASLLLPLKVVAAALGGTINSTGPVVAAASFLRDPNVDNGDPKPFITIASSVKIIQNAMIGFVAVGIAVYWAKYEEDDYGGGSMHEHLIVPGQNPSDTMNSGTGTKKRKSYVSYQSAKTQSSARDFLEGRTPGPKWWEMLWIKFPKFVLMFLILSVVLTIIRSIGGDTDDLAALKVTLNDSSKWWFTMGFAGVGLNSNLKALFNSMVKGVPADLPNSQRFKLAARLLAVYGIGQMFNIIVTYAVAYGMFFDFDIQDVA